MNEFLIYYFTINESKMKKNNPDTHTHKHIEIRNLNFKLNIMMISTHWHTQQSVLSSSLSQFGNGNGIFNVDDLFFGKVNGVMFDDGSGLRIKNRQGEYLKKKVFIFSMQSTCDIIIIIIQMIMICVFSMRRRNGWQGEVSGKEFVQNSILISFFVLFWFLVS